MDTSDLLRRARTILLIDYPSRAVPEALARSGYAVVAAESADPNDYAAYALSGKDVIAKQLGAPPERADILYSHRPLAELPEIIAMARRVGATAIWCETGSMAARTAIESAGLAYIDEPKIVEAVRGQRARA